MVTLLIAGGAKGAPSNSSAPISGANAPPFTDPAGPGRTWLSMSVVTPTLAPADSSCEGPANAICKSVVDTKGAAAVLPKLALSFEAVETLVIARQFVEGDVALGIKFATEYRLAAFLVVVT